MPTTLKAGTSSDELTWPLSDTTKPMRPISKLFTETAETLRSGALSVFCITRSTSTETLLMPTRELSG
jgi:hypothetical protein